ncbi:MAG: toxin HicA [Micrococcales bacterium]|nr:toxin HicA [Micrococcales bacterium]
MVRAAQVVERMRRTPQNVRYDDLAKVCEAYFGPARRQGTSHAVYKTPWAGDPRVNIQRGRDGKAKAYQVRQVLAAIDRLAQESAPPDGPAGRGTGGQRRWSA